MGENAHGIPFQGIPLSPSHGGGKQKRKLCGTTSEVKVPTCRFLAKKETVWRDLPAIFHNMAKKEGMWHDLKICQISFISLCTSTDHMGNINRK